MRFRQRMLWWNYNRLLLKKKGQCFSAPFFTNMYFFLNKHKVPGPHKQ